MNLSDKEYLDYMNLHYIQNNESKEQICKDLNITDENDYIIVNEKSETKEKGIFACGDSTKKEIYQIITAASEGATAAINAYKYIKEHN